jgi:hypothetical protein
MKATSLSGLPQKKLTTGHTKLERFGIVPERWLAMLDAPDHEMEELALAWPKAKVQLSVFSAQWVGKTLGVQTPDSPAPSPAPGRYIVYLPEVIRTPTDLRQTKASVWKDQTWYDQYQYTAKPGYWEVILFAPDSNSKSQSGQDKHITEPLPGFQRTPILVAALLLVCYKMATGKDLLDGDRIRCPEQASKGRFAIMYFYEGSLLFNVDCFDHPYDRFWASAARRLSS